MMFNFLKKPTHYTIETYYSYYFREKQQRVRLFYKWIPFPLRLNEDKKTNFFSQLFTDEYSCWELSDCETKIISEVNDWKNKIHVTVK